MSETMKMNKRRTITKQRKTKTNFAPVSGNARANEELKGRLQRAVKSFPVPAGIEAKVLEFIKTNSDFAKNGDERS